MVFIGSAVCLPMSLQVPTGNSWASVAATHSNGDRLLVAASACLYLCLPLPVPQSLVDAQKSRGFQPMAERIRRAGRMKKAHKPATRRSEKHRLSDRCRERLMIRSCCLTRTDSATTGVARPQESGTRNHDVDEKDDEIAH
jgi:hypothetical protein